LISASNASWSPDWLAKTSVAVLPSGPCAILLPLKTHGNHKSFELFLKKTPPESWQESAKWD
jgi:hypothetical protein